LKINKENIFFFRKIFPFFVIFYYIKGMETKTFIDSKELAKKELKELLSEKFPNFPILIIGERGTGKSSMVEKVAKEINKKPVSVNCASFADDTTAESELFGYVEGAFTGAKKGGDNGLFHEASKKENGILFLDEFHNLSKRCQAKLNLALQMEKNYYKKVRKFGSKTLEEQMQFQLVVATNITDINKLYKEYIFQDFYDRIAQNIIEIPSLRDPPKQIEHDWESNWEHMDFEITPGVKMELPKDEKLIEWLKTLHLYGNFRDLQRIAISYVKFEKYDPKIKALLPEKNAFDYAKHQFEKWKSPAPEIGEGGIDIKLNNKKNAAELLKDFHFELQNWAIKQYDGDKEMAAKELVVTPKTLDNWKNRK
jgi:transcriptional regulator with PAS, ATPase and Fis domain